MRNEITKLAQMCFNANLDIEINPMYMGTQIILYENGERVGDAAYGVSNYGYSDGLLEIMGKGVRRTDDDVEGWLTAEDVFERWTE